MSGIEYNVCKTRGSPLYSENHDRKFCMDALRRREPPKNSSCVFFRGHHRTSEFFYLFIPLLTAAEPPRHPAHCSSSHWSGNSSVLNG